MPRIIRKRESKHFQTLQHQSYLAKETNDCAVKALTLLTGLPYELVNSTLKKHGRKARKGTEWTAINAALDELGFCLFPLDIGEYQSIIDSYPGIHKKCKSITTHHPARFPKVWADMPPMLFDCAKHVAAFKDGELHDWSSNRSMRVRELLRLVKKNQEPQPVDAPATAAEPQPDAPAQPPYGDPRALGAFDYARGHTCCPYGDKGRRMLWLEGYKEAQAANPGGPNAFGVKA